MRLNSRAVLLALAENQSLKRLLVQNGMSRGVVQRFIAGEALPEALRVAKELQAKGIHAAMDFLGENVATKQDAEEATRAYLDVLNMLTQSQIEQPYVSVKLTALGLDLSGELAAANLRRILQAAQPVKQAFVRVDMEGAAYTSRTLDIVRSLHADFGNVGTVLQSYLYRTDDDVQQLIADGIQVRLVKGAYAEPPEIAYPKKSDVDAAYLRQMRALLLRGNRPAIATHDEAILRDAKRFIREHRIANTAFEFQLLLGIRRDLQEGLAEEGYPVRAYIPFGKTWYPYFMRRLAERPANIGFVLRHLMP